MSKTEDENNSHPSEQPEDQKSKEELTDEQVAHIAAGADRCGKCGSPTAYCTCNL